MVHNRSEAAKAAHGVSRRGHRHPVSTGARVNTRAPAVPTLQHNGPDIEQDSSEGRIQSPDTLSDSRAQTDLKDGSSHTQMGDVIPRTTSSALPPITRLRRSTPRTIHRTPELDSGPTAYELMEGIHPPTTPAAFALVYDHKRRQASSSSSQSTTSDRSSQLRSAEMLALATTNGNGSTSAGDKVFMRVAKRATEKFLRLYYRGVPVGQPAMEMIMYALRVGSKPAGLTRRALLYTLRTVVPGVLVTVRDVLTAEKTPEGSDHAPIPGAYPILAEGPEAAAEAEATSFDHVEPEPAPLCAQPGAARPQFRPTTRPEGRFWAVMGAPKEPSPKALTRHEMASRAARWNNAGFSVEQSCPGYANFKARHPALHRSLHNPYVYGPYPEPAFLSPYSPWSQSPFNPHGPGYVPTMSPRSNGQGPGTANYYKNPPFWYTGSNFGRDMMAGRPPMTSFANALCLGPTEIAKMERLQLTCLGPYWAERLSPFMGADGKELPVLKFTPDHLEICRALVQMIDPTYYVRAAVVLIRDDGQVLVAMRLEVESSLLSDDRGLITAGSSDNGATWDYVKATNELGDPTRVLYLSESYKDLSRLQDESSSTAEVADCNVSFLLGGGRVSKGSVVFHKDCSVSFLLEDGSVVDRSAVMGFAVDSSTEDVTMVDAHEEDVPMADGFD